LTLHIKYDNIVLDNIKNNKKWMVIIMSVQIDLENIIPQIVESFAERFSNKGLLISFHMSYSNYGDKENDKFQISKWVYIAFHRPNNYTRVFSLISDHPILLEKDLNKYYWNLECDHDSCWRTDGLRFIYDLKLKQIISEFNKRNLKYHEYIGMNSLNKIKFIQFDDYEYRGYKQKEVAINFKFVN
jgi:hypothetical protein